MVKGEVDYRVSVQCGMLHISAEYCTSNLLCTKPVIVLGLVVMHMEFILSFLQDLPPMEEFTEECPPLAALNAVGKISHTAEKLS